MTNKLTPLKREKLCNEDLMREISGVLNRSRNLSCRIENDAMVGSEYYTGNHFVRVQYRSGSPDMREFQIQPSAAVPTVYVQIVEVGLGLSQLGWKTHKPYARIDNILNELKSIL